MAEAPRRPALGRGLGALISVDSREAAPGAPPQDQLVRVQVEVGKANYVKHFGRDPQGIWLPECAFAPG